ncbi:MAG: PAS domain S-box protein [Anaerolineaceae bacterium]|nr:MAG: PAS domain S-box protein [Anaerolineaceae bacterium]
MNKSERTALRPSKEVEALRARITELDADVRAGKRVKKALDQNEINFRSLIENVQDVVARYDLDLRYLYVSPSLERYTDVKSEGLVGKTHREAGFSEELSSFFDRSLRQVIASRKPADVEFTAESRGILRFLESRAYPEFDESGNVKSVVTVTRDITERKRAEQALRESDERFKSIYSQSPVGIEIYDADGKMIDINPAGLKIFGIERTEQVRGFDIFTNPNITHRLRKKLTEGKPVAFESVFDFELVKKMGLYPTSRSGQCFIDYFITPLYSSGKSISGYVAHVREITERQKIAETLAKSEKRFRALIEHSADAISLIDAHGVVVYESPSTQRLTGYLPEERLGKSGFDLVHSDDLPFVKAILIDVIAHKGIVKDAQFRSVRKDGSVWWTEGTAVNLLHEPGVQAIVINYRDITHRKKSRKGAEECQSTTQCPPGTDRATAVRTARTGTARSAHQPF